MDRREFFGAAAMTGLTAGLGAVDFVGIGPGVEQSTFVVVSAPRWHYIKNTGEWGIAVHLAGGVHLELFPGAEAALESAPREITPVAGAPWSGLRYDRAMLTDEQVEAVFRAA